MNYFLIALLCFFAKQIALINSKASMLFYLEEPPFPNE